MRLILNNYKMLLKKCLILCLLIPLINCNNNIMDLDPNYIGYCHLSRGIYSNLIRMITKEGFHREINDKFEITVTNSPLPIGSFGSEAECTFGVLYKFTEDLYVDPYEQIDKNQARTMLILNDWTDLENPSWLATTNSSLLVQPGRILTGNLVTTNNIKIPIHLRYQKPIRNPRRTTRGANPLLNRGGYYEVQVSLPKLLIRCTNWPDLAELSEGGGNDCPIVTTLCSPNHSKEETCQWIVLPFKSNSKGSSVYVPVGDADSRFMVTFVTLMVILGGTLFILHSLLKSSREIENSKQKTD